MDARIQKQRIYTQTLDFEWSRVSFWPEDEEEEEEEEEDIEGGSLQLEYLRSVR